MDKYIETSLFVILGLALMQTIMVFRQLAEIVIQ